jgi:hypothetical protein
MNGIIGGIVTGLVGVAIVAVILSNRSNTSNVIGVSFQGLSNLFQTAVSPVVG